MVNRAVYVCVLLCLEAQNLELVSGKCNMYQESTDSHYYSSAESQPNAKNNGDFVYKVNKHLSV